MKKLLILLAILAAIAGTGAADEKIRRIQEELRKRSVYFGEIDGKRTEETVRALRAYQKRKGLKPTGEPDADTLAALNLASSPAEAPRWPNVPVLKSDTARRVREDERKLLEELAPVAEPPDLADALTPEGTEPPTGQAAAGTGTTGKEVAVAPRMSKEQAEEFVRNYLDACETNELAAEMAFYADEVKYFDHGVVDTAFIERDVAAFYKRWPKRSYHLYNLEILRSQRAETVVKFRIGFQYRSPKHRVAGKTDNVFSIRHTGGDAKFTALREQRLRD